MIKDTDERPNEEIQRAMSGKIPIQEPIRSHLISDDYCPMELGCTTLLLHGCIHQLGSFPNSVL